MCTEAVNRRDLVPPEVASRILRPRYFYTVGVAGLQVGYSRTQAYRAARAGIIPTERYGKLLLVPKQKWDRKVKRLLRGPKSRRKRAREAASTAA
jgi:hypothetical protein